MARRIALVEDDPTIRQNYADALARAGYEVQAFGDRPSAQAPVADDILHRGRLELDAQRMTAKWGGKGVDLTVTEFWMVHSLARHPGHVKERDQLMRDAEMVVDDGTITSHVKRIRKKFLAVDPAFAGIETVYGMGYRWMEGA
jgi:two-component system OmpR family response regulator